MAPEVPNIPKTMKSTTSKKQVTFLSPLKAHGHGSVRKPVPKKRHPLSSMSHNLRQVTEIIDLEAEDTQPKQVVLSRDGKGKSAVNTRNGESSVTALLHNGATKQQEQPRLRRIDEVVPVILLKKPDVQHLTPAERLRLAGTAPNPLNSASPTPPVTPTSLNPLNPLHHGHTSVQNITTIPIRTNTPAQRFAPLPISPNKTPTQSATPVPVNARNAPALPAPAINRTRVPAPLTLPPTGNHTQIPPAPLTAPPLDATRLNEPFRYLPPPVFSASALTNVGNMFIKQYQPLPSGLGSPGLARGDFPYTGDGFIDGLIKNDMKVWTNQTMETHQKTSEAEKKLSGEGQGRTYGDMTIKTSGDMDPKKHDDLDAMEED